MRYSFLTALFLTSASLLFGQLESDTIVVQASRSVNLTPDQVVLSVSVGASPNTSLDQIVAALSNIGITTANFSSMYGGMDNQWSFTLPVPFTKLNATIASLIALEQSIGKNNSGMSLMFQLQGSQVSPEAIQSQVCAAKDLVTDAQAQAQKVAAAAGLYIGPIIAISDGSLVAAAPSYAGFLRVGDFSAAYSSVAPSGCYLEVKFKLLRYQ
jgi:uncharacterized protein YggE